MRDKERKRKNIEKRVRASLRSWKRYRPNGISKEIMEIVKESVINTLNIVLDED